MSANNKLLIYKKKDNFMIENVDVDTGGGFLEGTTKTFREARELAKKIMSEEPVEYGVDYDESCFEDNVKSKQKLTKQKYERK